MPGSPDDNTDGERQAEMIRLWEMHVLADPPVPIREIARREGMSHATVGRWIRAVREADGFVDMLNRSEARTSQLGRLDDYLATLRARLAQGVDAERIIPVMLAVEDRITKVAGTAAPLQVQHEDMTARTAPDAELAAKVRDARARAERERAQIVDGEVIGDDRDSDDADG